ncbi:MAG: Lrp/AsnC family transcriptional regulator [Deltaproteobacteria bacterium]|nr:Lrp/AsnC family transcriptional regulator [Deltaproteobacteria bacterium]
MSKKTMTDVEKAICTAIQYDIPLDPCPFETLAKKVGIPEDEFINKANEFLGKGYIRRFGAAIRHRKAGITANGMGVWVVPDEDRERVGKIMATFKEVSHCYERPSFEGWPYNLFTMIHGRTKEDCYDVAKKISEATGIKGYKLLFSSQEFKKESMIYF